MKKKESAVANLQPVSEIKDREPQDVRGEAQVFLMDDGRLKPFSPQDYTTSTLYEVVESFSVECRLVRPEDPGTLVFEGKKPSRKTLPIIVLKTGDCLLLESWEKLESSPEKLAEAQEVLGVSPVRQAFVLKRK